MLIIRSYFWRKSGNSEFSGLKNPLDLKILTQMHLKHCRCPAKEKAMAPHSSVLAWRIPGTGEPGWLPSMGSHRVGHDWSDLPAAAAYLFPAEEIATHSSILAWRIPLTEDSGRLQSMESQELDMTEQLHFHFSISTFMHWRRKWQPTPVFLPVESQGQGTLVGCLLWGRIE